MTGGAYDPVQTETTETRLRVTGRIPDWLDGRYVRNGPNPIGVVDPAMFHYFMGDGMVHGVRLARRPSRVVPQLVGALPGRGEGVGGADALLLLVSASRRTPR